MNITDKIETETISYPDEQEIKAAVLGTVATVIISLLAYWKNNSFTEAAQVADKIMNELKKS